jgi:hypothetical protein
MYIYLQNIAVGSVIHSIFHIIIIITIYDPGREKGNRRSRYFEVGVELTPALSAPSKETEMEYAKWADTLKSNPLSTFRWNTLYHFLTILML